MMDQRLREKMFDAMLESAAEDYANTLADEMVPENELEQPHIFSAEFEQKMRALVVKKEDRSSKIRVVSFLLVAALSVCLLTVSVTAFRNPILDFFFNQKEEYTQLVPSDKLSQLSSKYQGFVPQRILEGFEVTDVYENSKSFGIKFENVVLDEYYAYTYSLDMKSLSIDTESSEFQKVALKGKEAFLSEKAEKTVLCVITENAYYYLSGSGVPSEDLINVMNSVAIQ